MSEEHMICSVAGAAEAADECDAERESAVCAEERTETDAAARAAMAGDALTGEFIRAGLSGRATVDTIRHYGWHAILDRLRTGSLGRDAAVLARETARLFAPEVWRSLFDMIREGSVPAVKLYMELCKDTERETAHGAVYGEEGAIRALREAIFSPRESADDSGAGEGDGLPREVIVGG